MAVVGPRHQLGKTIGLVAVFPQHSQGQSHTRCHSSSTAGHSSPRDGAQHLPHHSSEQLRLAEHKCHPSVPGLQRSLCPRTGLRQWQKNHVWQNGEGTEPRTAASAPGNAHPSPQGCSRGSSGLKPTLYLLQTKSVCTENSPAGAVLRLQTQSYELKFYASYFNPVSIVLIMEVFRAQPSLPPPRLPRARGSSGS